MLGEPRPAAIARAPVPGDPLGQGERRGGTPWLGCRQEDSYEAEGKPWWPFVVCGPDRLCGCWPRPTSATLAERNLPDGSKAHRYDHCLPVEWRDDPTSADWRRGLATRADLVPGRVQEGYRNYHSLYRQKTDSWTQTNVSLHTDTVTRSGRVQEIRAVKIWRFLRRLDFPSLYLELFVIRALSGKRQDTLPANVLHGLRTIGDSLVSARVEDPANTNNVLSDELSRAQKENIAELATQSAGESYWERIIW